MSTQGWDFYVNQAFLGQNNSRRVVRLLREMRCELRADRRLKDLKIVVDRRAGSALHIAQAGKLAS